MVVVCALGAMLVLGIWIVQFRQVLVAEYAGGAPDELTQVLADVEAGVEYAELVEAYAPIGDDPSGGLAEVFMQLVAQDVARQEALEGVAQQVLESLTPTETAQAQELPPNVLEEVTKRVEEEIR